MYCVPYYRVSTVRQGQSGLGLAAQRHAVATLTQMRGLAVIAEFTEVESGKSTDNRPQLHMALQRCAQTRATLVVARLDRLSRNAAFLLTLRDSGVKFIAADMPDANELTVGILALVAQDARETISRNTKLALAAAKARGQRLGNPNLPKGSRSQALVASLANREKALRRAKLLMPVVDDARAQGITSLRGLADYFNNLFIPAPSGGLWFPGTVRRLLRMLAG